MLISRCALIASGLVGSFLGGIGAAGAVSPTIGSLSVTLTIISDCQIAAGSTLAFGSHGVLAADLTASADLSITCTPGASYFIALDAGANELTTDDVNTRRMKANASDYIGYQLYKELGHSNVWGNSGSARVAGTGTGSPVVSTVYGVVPVASPPIAYPTGSYSDAVAVTISF
jgi:spore coat protein U-like protein